MSVPSAARNLRLLGWLNFCNDFRIYGAIAILYFTQVTGSFALGLSVFSVATVASALFELPTGVLSDLVGRKATVVFGQTASTLAIVCYALGGSFEMLALGAVLEGLSSALFSGNNSALLYDTLREAGQEDRYAEYEGKISAMFQVGLGLGALVWSAALGWQAFEFLFWLSVAPQFAGFVLAFFLVEPRNSHAVETNVFSHLRTAIRKFAENSRLRTLSLAKTLDWAIGESLHQFTPAFFATLWPAWAVSAARVLDHALAAVGFRFSGKMIERFGAPRVLVASGLCNYLVGVCAVAYPSMLSPALKSATSLGFGPGLVAQSSLLQKEFSDEQRATMGSLNSLAGSLCFAAMAALLGLCADRMGPQYAMLSLYAAYLAVFYLYWRLFKKRLH